MCTYIEVFAFIQANIKNMFCAQPYQDAKLLFSGLEEVKRWKSKTGSSNFDICLISEHSS